MNILRRLLAAVLFASALPALSQPPLLPPELTEPASSQLRDIEALVWSDPWTARKRLLALPAFEAEAEAARQLLLAQALLYLYLDDELAAAVEAGLAALDTDSSPILRYQLENLDGIQVARGGDFLRAASILTESADGARAEGLTSTALYATAELAWAYARAGDYETALLVLQDTAQEALLAQDSFLTALADETYGVIYTYIDEFDRAIAYSRRAIEGYEALGYRLYEAEAVFGLATAYRYAGEREAAIEAFRRYQGIMESNKDEAGRFSALYGLGMTQAELGDCATALPLIQEALDADGPPDYDAELLKRAAVCHARGGDATAARAALARSRAIIEGIPALEVTRWAIDLDKAESDVDAALGDFEQAYRALLRYHEAELALQQKNASEQRQSRRTALENDRQALQIELLQEQARVRSLEVERQQREQRNERLGFLLLVVGLALVAAIVLWRLRDLRKFRELSNRDDLTAVANRRCIFEQLQALVTGPAEGRGDASIVLIDVDDFKAINDHYGHPAGDQVLQSTAQALSGILRPGDEIARVGGEEFLLVLPRTDLQGAERVAKRARETLEALRVTVDGNLIVTITASIGIATTAPQRDTVDALYAAADEALYRAKAGGKNRVELAATA
ncbi:MAG: tetratricopeptide repeat-containing diguanylate cyclase [Pseudomonadota bacterium]